MVAVQHLTSFELAYLFFGDKHVYISIHLHSQESPTQPKKIDRERKLHTDEVGTRSPIWIRPKNQLMSLTSHHLRSMYHSLKLFTLEF